MSQSAPRPSSRHLSASPDRAELRRALRRDLLSWYPGEVYDHVYLSRYSSAADVLIRYLEDAGDRETAAATRRHRTTMSAAIEDLAGHPRLRP